MIARRHGAPGENGRTPGALGRSTREETGVTGSRRAPDRRLGRRLGSRIEADRAWTLYRTFNGAPAQAGEVLLTGLGQAMATGIMDIADLRKSSGRQAQPAPATRRRRPDTDPRETRGRDRWR